jgi:alpha,alpha-trehalose phosphorylase
VGHLDLAYDYFAEAALIDLQDLAENTHDGVHLASLASAWLVAVAGFGGLRDHGDVLSFAPRLPSRLTRMAFRLLFRGRRLRVEVGHGDARYELLDGEELELVHHGEPVTLAPGEPEVRPVPSAPHRPPPRQPPGREPRRRVTELSGPGP